jgi:hypothetical protein
MNTNKLKREVDLIKETLRRIQPENKAKTQAFNNAVQALIDYSENPCDETENKIHRTFEDAQNLGSTVFGVTKE